MITSRLQNRVLAIVLAGAALAGIARTGEARAGVGQDVAVAGVPAVAATPPVEPVQAPAAPASPPVAPAAPQPPVAPPAAPTPAARPARPATPDAPQAGATAQGQPDANGAAIDAEPRQASDYWRNRTSFRLGSDLTVKRGDTVDDAVVIAGTATIEGHVTGDVVVVAGTAHLASTAVVDGDFVVVGGGAIVDPGASVARDFVVVMGALTAPPDFRPGGEQTVIGPLIFGDGLRAAVPWVTTGLLWGRPIVPSLPWIWGFVAVCFATYLLLNLVFDKPVRACTEKLVERPLSAFMAGLLVLVLLGPVSVLLAASVVGIALIPFLLCAVFVAGLLGKVGVLRTIGTTIVPQEDRDNRFLSARSFALGFVAVTLVYMVPVIGLIGFLTLGVFGLGSSAMAFAAGLRHENPRPPAPRVPVPPPLAGAAPGTVMPGATVADTEIAATMPLPGDGFSASGVAAADAGLAPPSAAQPANPAEMLCYPRATFLERLGAFVLDLVLVALTFALLDFNHDGPGRLLLLFFVYRAAFWTWKGTTVGGIILQLRVVRTDGTGLTVGDAAVRGLSSIFSIVVAGLGCLWILRDPERQAWHDRIAGTYVVKVPRDFPLR